MGAIIGHVWAPCRADTRDGAGPARARGPAAAGQLAIVIQYGQPMYARLCLILMWRV